MKTYYYDSERNFGDAINRWLWDRLLPGFFDDDEAVRFCGIGTLLSDRLPPARHWIVFSSGVGYGRLPADIGSGRWDVVAVRGPLSAAALSLPKSAAVTDGAILLATLPEYAPATEDRREGVVFVPHHRADPAGNWRSVCAAAGIEYLDPATDSCAVIARLRYARLVLADAMHAAIISDTLRVPWVPVATSPEVSTFKWLDWTASMALPYRPTPLPSPASFDQVRHALLRLIGEHHSFPPTEQAAALAHLSRHNRRLARPWWPATRRLGRRLNGRILRELRKPYLDQWLSGRDDALAARAAAALAAATRGPSFLSSDTVFASRRDELNERLHGMAARVAPRSSHCAQSRLQPPA